MLPLMQAKEYVCCVDQAYVYALKSAFSNDFSSIDELRKVIFESLDDQYYSVIRNS
ncbi:MAG: hypothetical protein JWR23_2667 [Mucilaginibacter sp.]|jgi:hypothetical protein|nr:hypothetical protein [Mucilaginibacter sp.]